MGLEEVQKGLERQLAAERKALIEAAQQEAKDILASAKKDIGAYKVAVTKETEKRVDTIQRRELSTAKLGQQKRVLTAKKEQIDEAFLQAKKNLLAQSDKKRKEFLESLLAQAKTQIDVHIVYCAKQDKALLLDAKVSEQVAGGIICETKDGTQRVDLTVDRILSDVRQAHLKEVADALLS